MAVHRRNFECFSMTAKTVNMTCNVSYTVVSYHKTYASKRKGRKFLVLLIKVLHAPLRAKNCLHFECGDVDGYTYYI
jgi:hypothetical protein